MLPETELLLLLEVGAVADIISEMLGVGGGILLVPAFFYMFSHLGFDRPQLMSLCLATSLSTIVVTYIRSRHAHHRKGAVEWAILREWAPGLVGGAILGVLAVSALRSEVLQAIFGALAAVIGLYMTFGRSEWHLGDRLPRLASHAIGSPIVGIISVLMGIGGGSFGGPVKTLYNVPIHRAVATSAGFGLLIAVPSALFFLFVPLDPLHRPPFTLGSINVPAFAIVVAMTLITTGWGVRLAHAMDPDPLKRIFAMFLSGVAINMLWEDIT